MFQFWIEGLDVKATRSATPASPQGEQFAVTLKNGIADEIMGYIHRRPDGWYRGGHRLCTVLEQACQHVLLRHLADAWKKTALVRSA